MVKNKSTVLRKEGGKEAIVTTSVTLILSNSRARPHVVSSPAEETVSPSCGNEAEENITSAVLGARAL